MSFLTDDKKTIGQFTSENLTISMFSNHYVKMSILHRGPGDLRLSDWLRMHKLLLFKEMFEDITFAFLLYVPVHNQFTGQKTLHWDLGATFCGCKVN